MAKNAKIPVVLALDHGLTPELIVKAMDLGFTSVMYDCSTLPFEENSKRGCGACKGSSRKRRFG